MCVCVLGVGVGEWVEGGGPLLREKREGREGEED